MKNFKTLIASFGGRNARRDVLGILWLPESVNIAGVSTIGKKKEISFTEIIEIAGKKEEEIRALVQERLKDRVNAATRNALIVPSQLIISKNIEVPSTDSREIREIVGLQASRHTPFSKEEIIVGYIDIGSFKKNYTKVLLLIVPAAGVKKLYMQAEKAGIRVDRALFGQEGLASIAGQALAAGAGEPAGVVTLDEASSDFTVVIASKPAFVRSLPIGRKAIAAEPAKGMAKFAEEVKKSLDAYQAENIGAQLPGLIVMGSSVQGIEALEEALTRGTGLPVRRIQVQEWTGPLPDPEHAPAAGLLGAVLRFTESRVDLVPEEIRLKQKIRERARDLFTTGILSLCLLVMVMLTLMAKLYMKEVYLAKLESTYSGIFQEAQELEKELKKNSLVRSYKRTRGYSLRVLAALYELLPKDIELNSVSYKKDGKFAIKGTAGSMSTVFTFVDSLMKSGYFKEVKTRHTTKRQEGSRDLTDFEINALVKRTAENK